VVTIWSADYYNVRRYDCTPAFIILGRLISGNIECLAQGLIVFFSFPVAEWLECPPLVPKVPDSKCSLWLRFFKKSQGTRFFRAGEGEGGEKEDRHTTSVTLLSL